MTTFVLRNGNLVEKHPKHQQDRTAYVISDVMDPLKHPGTGQVIDSKARFREHTRASGCVEVGTDPAASRDRPRFTVTDADIVPDVKRAIAELNSR